MSKRLSLIKEHSSILIMALGAGSLFLLNIFLKNVLTSSDFGYYCLLITYLAMINSFGLMGVEQTVIRKCEVNEIEGKVYINRSLKYLSLLSIVGILFISFLSFYLDIFERFWMHVFSTLFIAVTMYCYNILRLLKKYHLSQIVLNFWRIMMLGIGTIVYLSNIVMDYKSLSIIIFILICFSGVFSLFLLFKYLRINYTSVTKIDYDDVRLTFYFLITLVSGAVISQGDKIFFDYYFSIELLGEYTYYSMLFLYPFSFLQNYLGFKFLVDFKLSKNSHKLKKSNLKILTFISIGFTLLVLALNVLIYMFFDNNNFNYPLLISLLLLTGNVKLFYSLYSSIIGVKSSNQILKRMNILFLVVLILVFGVVFYIKPNSVEFVAFLFLFLWVLRIFIWGYYSKTILSKKIN